MKKTSVAEPLRTGITVDQAASLCRTDTTAIKRLIRDRKLSARTVDGQQLVALDDLESLRGPKIDDLIASEAAVIAGMSVTAIHNVLKADLLPYRWWKGTKIIGRDDLQRYLDVHTASSDEVDIHGAVGILELSESFVRQAGSRGDISSRPTRYGRLYSVAELKRYKTARTVTVAARDKRRRKGELTLEEAARLAGVDVEQIESWIRERRLSARGEGKQRFVSRSELTRFHGPRRGELTTGEAARRANISRQSIINLIEREDIECRLWNGRLLVQFSQVQRYLKSRKPRADEIEVDEAARRIQVTRAAIYRAMTAGDLKYRQGHCKRFVKIADFDRFKATLANVTASA